MRVLQVHNRYNLSGGEDNAVESEFFLLKEKKNVVKLYEVTNEKICGFNAKIKTAINVCYSRENKKKIHKIIRQFCPDIVHVHNFFPLLTTSIYDAAIVLGVPVIQTLHNYRIMCPGSYLMRNGRVCEDCLTGTAFKAVLHGCYRGSRIGSLFVANMVQMQRKRKTWQKKVNRFITLSNFAKKKFIQAGIPSEKILVKPNFICPDPGAGNVNGKYGLFVGRLSEEKGITTLLKAWKKIQGFPIKIIGDGPLIKDIYKTKSQNNLNNVHILGQHDRNTVFQFIKNAKFIIFPSEWYETFGLSCVEAFACEKPVIASRLGSMAEIVDDRVTGLLFKPGDSEDLAGKIQWLIKDSEECRRMGKNARMVYLENYTAEKNYKILFNIYKNVQSKLQRSSSSN